MTCSKELLASEDGKVWSLHWRREECSLWAHVANLPAFRTANSHILLHPQCHARVSTQLHDVIKNMPLRILNRPRFNAERSKVCLPDIPMHEDRIFNPEQFQEGITPPLQ